MPKTKRGVYHNLRESEYTVSDSESGIVLFFSSRFYRRKFLEGYIENRKLLYERIRRSIDDPSLNVDCYADAYFYKEIEKRGFYVWVNGVTTEWQDLRKYALQKGIEKISPVWLETQKPKLTERLKSMM